MGDTAGVSNRPRPGRLRFTDQVARDFSFLVTDWGFTGPFVRPDETVIFDRADLRIGVWFWSWHGGDCGLETDIAEIKTNADGEHRYGSLQSLYMGARLGPAQHVPGGPDRIKHVTQHAAALRKLMPKLAGADWDDLVTRFGSVGPHGGLFGPVEVDQRSPGNPA